MERCSLLNGNIANQDSDYSAPLLALMDGGVVSWLQVSHLWAGVFEVSAGSALIKCIKTNEDKVLIHFQNTDTKTLTFIWPQKVRVEVFQNNLDNPMLNPVTGLGIGEIKYGVSYPLKNHIPLASIDGSNAVTDARVMVQQINTIINQAITQIQIGSTTFSGSSSWPANVYNLSYSTPIPANTTSDPTSIPQNVLLYFKAHQTNTTNIMVSVNTTEWTLTAPLKKMNDQDLTAGDIETWQRVIMQRWWSSFQMQSQVAQAPVWTVQNVAIQWQVGEDVMVGQVWFVGKWVVDKMRLEQLEWNTTVNVGDGINIRLRAMILTWRDNILRKVTVNLGKVGSPGDQIYCRLYDTDGTTLIASSTNFFNNSTIASSNEQRTFLFSSVILQPQTKYFVTFERTGGNDPAHHYTLRSSNTNLIYPLWFIEKFNGSVREWLQWYTWISVQLGYNHEPWKRYLAQPEYESTAYMDGIFTQNKNNNEVCNIVQDGTANSFSNLTPWNNYYLNNIDIGNKNTDWNTTTHFGHSVGNQEKVSMSFRLSYGLNTNSLFFALGKNGTPTDNVVFSIQTDDNGKPSGTLVHANAIGTISWSNLIGSAYRKMYNFNGYFDLLDSTIYWIVLERDGWLNTSHYYNIQIRNSDVYPRGNMMTYTNTAWVNQSRDMYFSFMQEYDGARNITYNENRNFGNSSGGSIISCQSFQSVDPRTIKSIMLALWQVSSPTDSIRVRIEKNFSQIPSTTWYQSASWNSNDVQFGTPTIERYAQSFIGTQYLETWILVLQLKKNSVPTDEMRIRIETDDSGLPSGTLIDAQAITTIAPSALSTSFDTIRIQFPSALKFTASTKYWIVLERTGATNAVHSYSVGRHTSNVYASGETKSYNGSVRADHGGDIWFRFQNQDFMVDAPSGELVDPNAELTFLGSQLTTGFRTHSFNFATPFAIQANTKYWIVISRTGSQHSAGYYQCGVHNGGNFMFGQFMETNSNGYSISWLENRNLFFNFWYHYERPKGQINNQISSYLNRCTFIGRWLSNSQLAIKNGKMVWDNPKTIAVNGWTSHSASCTYCNTEVWWNVFTVGIWSMRFEVWWAGNRATTGRLYMAEDEQTLLNGWGTLLYTLTTGNVTFIANPTKKYRIRLNGSTTCGSWCSASHYAQIVFEPYAGVLIV